MVKLYALILSCLSFILLSTPAHAGRLLFWRYEAGQNRLIFTTDQGVQPTAQLIADPTRLVIDLPGTVLGRPTINENLGRVITNLRIGQFDTRTTRMVIELAPGYILDPQQIKIKGISPTQWSVDLPDPQRGSFPSTNSNNSSSFDRQSNKSNQATLVASNTNLGDGAVRVTSSGLLVGVDGSYKNKIKVERSKDRRQIKVEIDDLNLSENLRQSWPVNQYGISNLDITQISNSKALITINVNPDSPDWQASFSRMGGLVLWPQGGISRVNDLPVQANRNSEPENVPSNRNSSPIPVNSPVNTSNNNQIANLEFLEVDYNQLIIRSDKSINARANWSNGNQVYQIRLENTKLSPNFRSPQLSANSPISRLRIWEPNETTVVLLIEPARNTQIQRFNQLRDNLWTLSLNPNSRLSRRSQVPVSRTVQVDPLNTTPQGDSPSRRIAVINPPANTSRPTTSPVARNSRALVVIDPGHGGKDPGAIGIGGVQEKHVVMAISNEVTRILESQGVQVKMTRGSDYFVSLQGRTSMANKINADLFVSIHANSAGRSKPHVNGYETYYFQSGRNLASVIHRNVLRRVNVNDRKVRQARFYVLRKSAMPAVLVETGFLSGREDVVKLNNSRFQKQMAQAIAAGILEYINANRL